MRVKALVSFFGKHNGEPISVTQGEVITLPRGADWVKAGLCVPVGKPEKTTALDPGAEQREER